MVLDSRRVVTLVGCSGPKLDRAAPARELYMSDLFRKARAVAERGPWAILSAKHLAVLPDKILDPYQLRLEELTENGRQSWALWTNLCLRQWFPGARFVLLAGEAYRAALTIGPALPHTAPLEGLGIGERLSWLKREGGLFAPAAVPT